MNMSPSGRGWKPDSPGLPQWDFFLPPAHFSVTSFYICLFSHLSLFYLLPHPTLRHIQWHGPWCFSPTMLGAPFTTRRGGVCRATPTGWLKRWTKASPTDFLFCFVFRPYLRHTEVPRLGVEWELQLPAYTTAMAMPDPSHICKLHHSNVRSFNPLSWTLVLIDTVRFLIHSAMTGTPGNILL